MKYLLVLDIDDWHVFDRSEEIEALGFTRTGTSPRQDAYKDLPIFEGLCGPMDLHDGQVRYETQKANDIFSH